MVRLNKQHTKKVLVYLKHLQTRVKSKHLDELIDIVSRQYESPETEEYSLVYFKDYEMKNIIENLLYLNKFVRLDDLVNLINEIFNIYEDQRMMTREETDEMVKWALENVK